MIEHCIAAFRANTQEREYRIYITDALKAIVENTSKSAIPGVGMVDAGIQMTKRWIDLSEPQKTKVKKKDEEDTRSCSEIAADMWDRIKGKSQ